MTKYVWSAWGGRFQVFLPDSLSVSDSGCEYSIGVRLHQGRLVINYVGIYAPEVTTETLRQATLHAWVIEAAQRWAHLDGGKPYRFPEPGFNKVGMTDEALDQFAQHYAYLMVTGQRPSGVFLQDYGIPRPTTSRWLSAARKRGLLQDKHVKLWHVGDRPLSTKQRELQEILWDTPHAGGKPYVHPARQGLGESVLGSDTAGCLQ